MKICTKRLLSLALSVGASLILAGCYNDAGQRDIEVKSKPADSVQDGGEEPSDSPQVTRKKLDAREQIAHAMQDLAEKLDLDVSEISYSGATPVIWRSSALGCPEPGMNYTQMLIDGVWIMLRVDKKVYRYHAAVGSQPFFCPDERAEPPVQGSGAD